ncbi:MAG: alanine racemase [Gammaproteobacteria bacterium]|nr:alanine racemase [Gammaproteobacteria bacterium]
MKGATAQIDTQALQHNLAVVRSQIPANTKVVAVVKANAYGHGLIQVAKTLASADAYAVARLEEALILRSSGIVKPIIMLEGFFSADDLPVLAANNIQTAVHSVEQLDALEQMQLPNPVTVWLKLDTGMHRLGVRPEEAEEFCERLANCRNVVQPFNFITHFSRADELDNLATTKQIELFNQLTQKYAGECSLASSAGIMEWHDAHADWIRPGIMLYGASPFLGKTGYDHGLQPVMTLKTSLIAVRLVKQGEPVGYGAKWVAQQDTKVGVVAIGYGDGYPRMAPSGVPVLVNGRIVPLVGRVSMDMLTVDLGPDAADKVGDDVTLWGEGLPVETVAEAIGTIPYELITKLTPRVIMEYK